MDRAEMLIQEAIDGGTLIALALSEPRQREPDGCRKVIVRPVQVKGERRYQFERQQERKAFHRNLTPEEAKREILALLRETFRQGHLYTPDADIQLRADRSGRLHVQTRPPSKTAPMELRHDRQKPYLLPEGRPVDFLVRLGVMTKEGRVIAARYDKFRQINRFLEMVADVVEPLDPHKPLRVVDFGCGKSYLTFALYHYLHTVKAFDVQIVGLDLKADVVAHCEALARDLDYTGLSFTVGDIAHYEGFTQVEMVVSLHACDTATDDALAKAVQWGAQVILSVPCCQHELFRQIRNEAMQPLLKHGLFKERLSALVTDSLRALRLELAGYSVQVLEFIALEHTPKNLLLRAVRQGQPAHPETLLAEYRAFRDFWHVRPAIDTALGDLGTLDEGGTSSSRPVRSTPPAEGQSLNRSEV